MTDPWVHRQKARKEYRCARCSEPITAGTEYDRVTHMIDYEPDVDDEGRTIGVKLDKPEWFVERIHTGCPVDWPMYYGEGY